MTSDFCQVTEESSCLPIDFEVVQSYRRKSSLRSKVEVFSRQVGKMSAMENQMIRAAPVPNEGADKPSIPAEIRSMIIADLGQRPGMHFFRVALSQGDYLAQAVGLTLARGPVILGERDPTSTFDRLVLTPPANMGWYSDANESGYTRWAHLRTIEDLSRYDIDRFVSREDGWLSIQMPVSGFNRLITRPADDVFVIEGLDKLDSLPARWHLVLAYAFLEQLRPAKRLCYDIRSSAPIPSWTYATMADAATLNFPNLECLYILDRLITLKPGRHVPQGTIRYFGNGCTFVEVREPNEGESDELYEWHVPQNAQGFTARDTLRDYLKNTVDDISARHPLVYHPSPLPHNSEAPAPGPFGQDARDCATMLAAFVKFRVLARVEGYVD